MRKFQLNRAGNDRKRMFEDNPVDLRRPISEARPARPMTPQDQEVMKNIESVFSNMANKISDGFGNINTRLQQLDSKIDHSANRIRSIEQVRDERAQQPPPPTLPKPRYDVVPGPMYEAGPQKRYTPTPQSRQAPLPQARYEPTPQSRHAPLPQSRYETMPQSRYEQVPQSRYATQSQSYIETGPQSTYDSTLEPRQEHMGPIKLFYSEGVQTSLDRSQIQAEIQEEPKVKSEQTIKQATQQVQTEPDEVVEPKPPTPIHTKTVRSAPLADSLSEMWQLALTDYKNRDFNRAYERVIASGDDLYLLRLMLRTGCWLKELRPDLVPLIVEKICLIMKSEFIENAGVSWIESIISSGAFSTLWPSQQSEVASALNKMKSRQSENGELARSLYSYISK